MFPLFFSFNFIILISMIRVNLILLKKYTPVQLIKFAIIIQIIAAILMILNHQGNSLIITMILMASYMSMMAFIFGNCMALALEHFSKNAGVAASVIGVLQFGLGAIISSIALSFHTETFLPIALSITIISFTSYLIIRTYK